MIQMWMWFLCTRICNNNWKSCANAGQYLMVSFSKIKLTKLLFRHLDENVTSMQFRVVPSHGKGCVFKIFGPHVNKRQNHNTRFYLFKKHSFRWSLCATSLCGRAVRTSSNKTGESFGRWNFDLFMTSFTGVSGKFDSLLRIICYKREIGTFHYQNRITTKDERDQWLLFIWNKYTSRGRCGKVRKRTNDDNVYRNTKGMCYV